MLRQLVIRAQILVSVHERRMETKILGCFLLSIFVLSGCSSDVNQSNIESADEISAGSVNAIVMDTTDTSEYSLYYDDIEIKINADSEVILSQIGTPKSSFESPLCGMDGKDILFDYGHFDMDVFETKDGSYVYSIVFKDDLITTKEGVFIGETEQKVREIYGEEQEKRGESLIYKGDSMELIFIIYDGVVTSIQYVSTTAGI